ncbi:MAG: ABC transporter ATP-binding protein/permease [Alphaproteobacteria bacterium]|nr:ABC transporter ATP-binding protein/permease [Alphaproteobacteria bacterium]
MPETIESDKYSSYSLVKRIFTSYIIQHKTRIIAAVIFMLIVAAASAFHVWLVKPALDGIFINKNTELLWMVPAALLITTLIKGIADYYQSYLIKYIGQNVVNSLQLDLYKKLLFSDMRFLNKNSSGNLISRFTNDILNLKNAISLIIVNFFRESLTLIFLLVIMFYNDAMLSLISFFVFPLAIIPIITMGKRMKKIAHQTQEELASYTGKLDENFRNIKIIKSFCTEAFEVNAAKNALKKLLDCYNKAIKIESLSSPIMESLGGVAVAAVILYGGNKVLSGTTSPGSFFSFIVAFFAAYQPLKNIANLNVTLQSGLASAKRIFDLIDTKHTVEEQMIKAPLVVKDPSVEFDNVFFKYGKKDALKGVSIKIKPFSLVAVVGESGGGKSTMLDLLLKFNEPYQGSIKIGGKDIKTVSPGSVRSKISIVSQDIMLFDSTIEENIRYGSTTNLSKKKLKESAKIAAAEDFIESLPKKYDTKVGQFGVELSGGQKQRIAIARAVFKESDILVFDEATSALDQSSEQIIRESIDNLKSKKTIILVTHRLSSIEDADCIYVLKDGKVAEHGKHKELLDNNGEYYRLYHKRKKSN